MLPQLPFGGLLVASLIAGGISLSIFMTTFTDQHATIDIVPAVPTTHVDTSFNMTLNVRSTTPVNVFKGLMHFDAEKLRIDRIDYNTSIADLWAEEPWYSNGEGTLSFIGGTTKPGGFMGEDTLITVTFTSIASGEALIGLDDVEILRHDGYGTNAPLRAPIDLLFTITPEEAPYTTIATPKSKSEQIIILAANTSTDLNGDGQQSIADISIFMRHLATQNLRSDFNGDSLVSTKDLSIIMLQL